MNGNATCKDHHCGEAAVNPTHYRLTSEAHEKRKRPQNLPEGLWTPHLGGNREEKHYLAARVTPTGRAALTVAGAVRMSGRCDCLGQIVPAGMEWATMKQDAKLYLNCGRSWCRNRCCLWGWRSSQWRRPSWRSGRTVGQSLRSRRSARRRRGNHRNACPIL